MRNDEKTAGDSGALADIEVVDAAGTVATAYCGKLFRDLGARVTNLEPPGRGHPIRGLPPFHPKAPAPEASGLATWLSLGKRSVAVHAADEAALQLLRTADIILDDDPGAVRELHDGQIRLSLSWFGATGPYAARAATDQVISAHTAAARAVGPAEGPPILTTGHTPQVVAGTLAYVAGVGHLLARETGGLERAVHLDVSIFEAAMCITEPGPPGTLSTGVIRPRVGINRFWPTYPACIYPCRDGWLGVTTVTPSQWRSLCSLLGLPELASEPRYQVSINRLEDADRIDAALGPRFLERTGPEWVEAGQAARIPLALAPTPAELLELDQFRDRGAWVEAEHPDQGSFPAPGTPFRLHRTPATPGGSAPRLGEHGTRRAWGEAPSDLGASDCRCREETDAQPERGERSEPLSADIPCSPKNAGKSRAMAEISSKHWHFWGFAKRYQRPRKRATVCGRRGRFGGHGEGIRYQRLCYDPAMPLTQRQVDAIRPTGKPFKRYDRDGLMVRVTAAGKGRWVWRGVVKGKRIEVGMGSTRFRSLKQAREVAFEHTRTARLGGDPRAPVTTDAPTFREAATLYLEIQSPDWGEEHAKHVRRLLEQHAFPGLGDLPVNEIQTADLMRVLVPLWRRQRPTGRRLRQRIAGVMAWSVAAGYRSDDPTSTLSAVLPAGRRKRKHHRYLPAEELREALVKVQASGAWIGTRLAMRFLALTAARSGEVRGARWREFDLESATWTVPASRMKSRKEHRVPLSSAALAVLERADGLRGRSRGLVFPGIQGKMVGAAVFGRLLKDLRIDCSPHGFRSSFRSWCSDEGIDREVAEQALAHAVGSQVEQCYARSDVLERRREVMEAWGAFLT